MSSKNPGLLAVAEIPVAPEIKAHSIIPVMGDGDPSDGGKDGVVAYESAHVDYVESELVDQEAFEALYRSHVAKVFALALRLTGDRGQAAELVQDTFVRAWEALPRFRGESALGTWLHRIAVNVLLESRRAEGRRSKRVMFAEDPGEMERPATEASPGVRMDLERAIAGLPEGARVVFVLHDVEGYEHREIGRMTGIAEGTSKAQLFRARRLLRKALDR
jgi:RNA polymerase sigma-70 factor (ECF subfamily)